MFHRGILVRQEYKFRSVSKSSGQLEFLLEIPFRLVHLCRLHLKELVFPERNNIHFKFSVLA